MDGAGDVCKDRVPVRRHGAANHMQDADLQGTMAASAHHAGTYGQVARPGTRLGMPQ